MKFRIILFFILFILSLDKSFSYSYLDFSFEWKDFNVIMYDKQNKDYKLKVAVSDKSKSLWDIAMENNSITWINWVFFCPSDYRECWKNSHTINERYIKWEKKWFYNTSWDRVVFAWDEALNTFLYQSEQINQDRESDIYYGLANFPLLLQDGKIKTELYRDKWLIDNKMKLKITRNFICSDKEDKYIYFWFVSDSSIDDLALALLRFWCYNAINLDAGYSSAFLYNWSYIKWPGREVLDWIFVEAIWLDTKSLDKEAKSILKLILKYLDKNDLSSQIKYLEKLSKKFDKSIDNIYYKNTKSFKSYDYKLWVFYWKKTEFSSKRDQEKIYLLNRLYLYLNTLIKKLIYIEKISNIDFLDSMDLDISVNFKTIKNDIWEK